MVKILSCICVSLLICISGVTAAEDAGFPGEYLYDFSSSARALGMGRACAASSFDAAAPYTNPAGLAKLISSEGTFLYVPLFEDTVYYFLGIGYPISEGSVCGMSVCFLEISGIENTEYGREFSDKQIAYIFSYGRKVNSVDLGINLKVASHEMDNFSGTGFGLDCGGQYKYKNIFLGLTVQNILRPKLKLNNVADEFPTNIKLGTGYEFLKGKMLAAFDLDFINIFGAYIHPVKWHLGLEYKLYEFFKLRTGIDYKELTFGIGFAGSNISLDYGFSMHAMGPNHRVSLSSRFGLLPTAAEKLIEDKQKEADSKLFYAYGLEAYSNKDYEKAKEQLQEVLKLDPHNEEAKKMLNRATVALHGAEARELYLMAIDERGKGNEKFAQELITTAKAVEIRVESKLEKEFFIKAHEYMSTKEYVKAKEALEIVLQVNPENKEASDLLVKIEVILQFTE